MVLIGPADPAQDEEDAEFLAMMAKQIDARGGVQTYFGVAKHPSDKDVKPAWERTGDLALPPCLVEVADALERGDAGVGHMARFALASFLAKRDVTTDEIEKRFVNAPNYDPALTHEQVAGIMAAGYAPPSCQRMRTLGLCREDDTCRERCVTTPLSYPRSGGWT